jgi:(p)ppGpp synthase/HD superfamily hydrolase
MSSKSRIALRYWLLGQGWTMASEAMEYGERHHTGTRKDGATPEFDHQVEIANFVRTLHPHLLLPEETIATVFMHDLREDYDISDIEIRIRYGKVVADAVAALTKTFRGVRRDPMEVAEATGENPIASIVKPADRIHNQHTCIGVFTPVKINEYVQETEQYILPMIREARMRFPSQEPAYENLKFVLKSQVQLLRAVAEEASCT